MEGPYYGFLHHSEVVLIGFFNFCPFLLDGEATELSEVHGPITLYPVSFTIIESDFAALTTLAHASGAQVLRVVGPYGIEPRASDHLNPIHGLVFSVSRSIAQDEIVLSRRRESRSGEPVRRRHLCVRGNFYRTFERGAGVADVGGRLKGSKNNAERISPPARCVSIPSFVGYLTS